MSTARSQIQRGHEEPFGVQFSVFLANRVGQLTELLSCFAQENLALLGISIVDSADWAVVRMVLSDPNRAREAFKQRHISYTENEVLLVELPDDRGLAKVCSLLVGAEINVNFAYPLTLRSHGQPVMVLHVEEPLLAVEIFTRHGLTVLGKEDLADPT